VSASNGAAPAAAVRGRSKQTIERLEAAIRILEEIQPATVRAVCYRLFVKELIRDMGKSCTNGISRLLVQAREGGQIPWQWIVDETRAAEYSPTWSNPKQYLAYTLRNYRRDYWQDQDFRVECWSEKATVGGTIRPVLDEYGVTFRVHHGYSSATAVNDIADLSNDDDRPLIAFYVGDHDPSGRHMSDVDLPERLDRYGATGVQLIRIALTDDDVKRCRLPRRDPRHLPGFSSVTKRNDSRYEWFDKHFGKQCCELDAMPPPELRDRVEQAIRSRIDFERWNHACMVESAELESMKDWFSKSWQAGHEKQEEAEVIALPPGLTTWKGLAADEYGSRLAVWLICGVVTEVLAAEILLPGNKRPSVDRLLTNIPREQLDRLIAELPARIKKRRRREALAETIERSCDAFIARRFGWTKPVSAPPGQLSLL